MKGVIPTPDIAKNFHPTPDIEGKKFPTPDIQNFPRHSTPNFIGRTCVWRFGHLADPSKKQAETKVNMLVNTRTPSRCLGRAWTVHEPNHTSTTTDCAVWIYRFTVLLYMGGQCGRYNYTKSTLDTLFFKSTSGTVKYLIPTLDIDPPSRPYDHDNLS